MRWNDFRSSASSSSPAASTGSSGIPRLRAYTLVEPPGSGAIGVSVPPRPSAASLSVPSPASTATTSTPSAAAPRARRAAWPRRLVSTTSRSWSAPSAFWMITRLRAVTDDAVALTMRRTRTTTQAIGRPRGHFGSCRLLLEALGVLEHTRGAERLLQLGEQRGHVLVGPCDADPAAHRPAVAPAQADERGVRARDGVDRDVDLHVLRECAGQE